MIRFAAISQRHLLKNMQYTLRYTRNYFEQLNIDKEQIQRNKKIQAQQKLKQQVQEIKSNDKNPSNFIKNLKIDSHVINYNQNLQQKYKVRECAIISPEPKKAPILFSVNRRYITTTLKKATIAMKPIRKTYLLDAIVRLQQSQKKVSRTMLPTLYNVARHAVQKNLNPVCLYIHGVIVGKKRRFRGIRFHAKGRGGREQKDICQIKLIIQQKDQKQFFEKVGAGEAPPGFATIVRNRLIQINAGYDKLVQVGGITTAKGRQQKRQIIKRKVSMIMNENKKNNEFTPMKLIQKKIRQEQGAKIKQVFYNLVPADHVPSIKRREKLYKKNMGIE